MWISSASDGAPMAVQLVTLFEIVFISMRFPRAVELGGSSILRRFSLFIVIAGR